MNERLNMSDGDIDRLRVIRDILEGRWTWSTGAKALRLSVRQVGRLCAAVRKAGSHGVLHGLRGKPSNNRLDPELLGKALSALHQPRWHDFGPVFCVDHLEDLYGIILSEGTVRRLKILTNLWQPRRRGTTHRAWRERRACVGMLVQLDGSPHAWLEGRGPRFTLLIYIDDATSRILYGEFIEEEDTLSLMRATKIYLRRWGRPVAFYVDKDSIYTVNLPPGVEEQLRGERPITQFTRGVRQLNIEVILANSPQAKGRVERGFDTHQDRLVKELRLADISTMEEANKFLQKVYIPDHNRRFAIEPANPADAHRPLLPNQDLKAILAIHTQRQVQNDFTIRNDNRFFQLDKRQPVRLYRKAIVTVQDRLDGSMHIVFKDQRLRFHAIPGRPLPLPRAIKAKALRPLRKHGRHTRPWCVYAAGSNEPTNPPASALLVR